MSILIKNKNNRMKKIILIALMFLIVFNVNNIFAQQGNESYQFSYAVKLYNEKFYDLASQQFSQYITKYQGDKQVPDAHFYLAKCYENMQKYDLAVIEYKKLSLDFSDHPKAILAWKESGKLYESIGKLKEAGKSYENIQILYSENEAAPEGLLLAGKVYYKIKESVDARKVFSDILSRYPESPYVFEAELFLAKIAIDEGDYPRGIEKLRKLIQGQSGEKAVPAKIELAKTYLNMNNVARAESILNDIPEKNQNLEAVNQYIRLFWKKKQYAESIAMLQKKLRNAGEDKHLFQELLIDAYTLNGDYELALALYGKISKEKISKNLKYKQLLLMVKKNDFNNFNKLLFAEGEKLLNDQVSLRLIKKSLNQMKEKKAITEMLELAGWLRGKYSLSEFNNHFAGFYFLALYDAKKYEELKRYFTQNIDMLREKPAVDDALYFRSMVALQDKEYKNAFEYLSDIENKYPFSPYVENAIKNSDRIEKYFLKDEKMDMDKVIHFLGVFINEKDAGNLNLLLGEMCAEQVKDFEKAMQYYKTALQLSKVSGKPAIYLKMYEASWALSQKDPEKFASQSDSAKIYLKNYLQNVDDEQNKTMVSLDFLKKTLNEIKANPAQKDQWLKKLQAWKLNGQGDLFKINDLIYSIISEDSMVADMKAKSGEVKVLHHDYWLETASSVALRTGDVAGAEMLWLKLLQNYPASPYAKQAALELLNLYSQQDAWQKYKQVFNFASTQFWYDEAIDISSKQNMVWLKNGDYEQVTREFKKIYKNQATDIILLKELYPKHIEDSYRVGLAYYYLNKIDSSNYYLNNFLALSTMGDKRQDEIYKILGELMLSENNENDAIWYLSRYSDESDVEKHVVVKNKLIELYENKKQYTDVKNVSASLSQKFPTHGDVMKWNFYRNRAELHLNKGKTFTAIVKSFKTKFKKQAGYKKYLGDLYIDYVYLAKEAKNFKYAEAALKNASKLKVEEQKPHILYLKGYLATVQNKDEDGLKHLSEFTGKYRDSEYLTNVYLTLGHLFYRSEKKSDALDAYQKGVDAAKNPTDLELALNNLIVLNKELGFWDGVLKACRQYISAFPEHFTNIEKQMLIGLSYSRLNRFDEAITYFREIKPFAGSEREPEIQFYIGEAFFNGGRYQEAISEFLKIPMLSKKTELQWEASALYYAGQSYERLNKKSEAIHMYKEIVSRPGILWELKKEAQKKIDALQ